MKAAAVVILSWAAAFALAPDRDDVRSAWRFRRPIGVGEAPPGAVFAALPVSPELLAASQGDLRDLRLVDPAGDEVPYVRDVALAEDNRTEWAGRLADVRREAKVESVWTVDLGDLRRFDRVDLDVRAADFAKRCRVDVSDDGASWRVARADAGLFDRAWGERVHHTRIELTPPVKARHVRLTLDDRRSKPVEIEGAVVSAGSRTTGTEWTEPAPLVLVETKDGVSRYLVEVPAGLAFRSIRVDADDEAFARRFVLEESRDVNGREETAVLGQGRLYRLRLEGGDAFGGETTLGVRPPTGGRLSLLVENRDSPPLRRVRATVSAPVTRLLFPASRAATGLTLYYGNTETRPAVYDIESLQEQIRRRPDFAPASLGAEAANPRFQPVPPLPFPAVAGAPIERPRWRAGRRLASVSREDLYTVVLEAEDMALARDDLGDVRLVDDSARQVPFILETDAARVPLRLVVERVARPAPSSPSTRYRLKARSEGGDALRVPMAALEVVTEESFFTRPAAVWAEANAGESRRDRALYSGTLSAASAGGRQTLVLPLAGVRESDLWLEIDEGDNAPLTIVSVDAMVPVARVAFKVRPGTYELLVGNERAETPRYDIATLRREVLAHSAVVLGADPLKLSGSFRPSLGDTFRRTPPAALLWGGLLAAVVVLLLLTLRILRQPAAPDADPRDPPSGAA